MAEVLTFSQREPALRTLARNQQDLTNKAPHTVGSPKGELSPGQNLTGVALWRLPRGYRDRFSKACLSHHSMPFAWGKGFKVANPNFKEICLFVVFFFFLAAQEGIKK